MRGLCDDRHRQPRIVDNNGVHPTAWDGTASSERIGVPLAEQAGFGSLRAVGRGHHHVLPPGARSGDRATLLLNLSSGQSRERTADELAPVNAHYGFDDSIWQQYVHYLTGLLRGDLGTSYQLQQPVTEIIADQIAPTLILTISALIVAWLIVLVLTTLTAGRHGFWGTAGSFIETVNAGLPQYWLGSILLVVFAINLGWFPVESGTGLWGLVLPVLTLAIPLSGFLGQVARDEFTRAL